MRKEAQQQRKKKKKAHKKQSLRLCRRRTACLGGISRCGADPFHFWRHRVRCDTRAAPNVSVERRTLLAVPAARLNPKPELLQNDKHPRPPRVSPTSPWFLVGAPDQHASPAVTLSDLGSAACCFSRNAVAAYQLSKFMLELSRKKKKKKREKLRACQAKKKEKNQKPFFFVALFRHQGCTHIFKDRVWC